MTLKLLPRHPARHREVHRILMRYGIMEKKVETTIVYWGYIGKMEEKTEANIFYEVVPPFGKILFRFSRSGPTIAQAAVVELACTRHHVQDALR